RHPIRLPAFPPTDRPTSRSAGGRFVMLPREPRGARGSHASPRLGRWATWLLLMAGLAATRSAAAATLTRGPYLQLRTTHSITVMWSMNAAGPCGLALRSPTGATTVLTGATAAACVIPVDGLSPGATYGYTPLAGNVPLRTESVFRTDDPQAPFSFLVVGDTGSGSPMQYAVRDAMLA